MGQSPMETGEPIVDTRIPGVEPIASDANRSSQPAESPFGPFDRYNRIQREIPEKARTLPTIRLRY
jgi:hypothetical protein